MKVIRKKLIISVFMVLVAIVTLTSTTYAWFSQNREAWLDTFDIEIQNTDGLLISIDGKTRKSNLNKEDIKRAIIAKMNDIDLSDNAENLSVLDSTGYIDSEYNKIKASPVTTKNLTDFYTIEPKEKYINQNGYYDLINASKYSFVQFDLWFFAESSKNSNNQYHLSFVSNDYAQQRNVRAPYLNVNTVNNQKNVILTSSLSTLSANYQTGDVFETNPQGAARIGVKNQTENIFYEPYIGVGSYAIDGETLNIYAPESNAMFTYFNSRNDDTLQALPSDDSIIYKNTLKNFEGNKSFGTLIAGSNQGLKITISIWIEAYDADYIDGIQASTISTYLSFKLDEVGGDE